MNLTENSFKPIHLPHPTLPKIIIQPLRLAAEVATVRYVRTPEVGKELHYGRDGSLILTEWWAILKTWVVYVQAEVE